MQGPCRQDKWDELTFCHARRQSSPSRSYLIMSHHSILHFIFEPDFNTGLDMFLTFNLGAHRNQSFTDRKNVLDLGTTQGSSSALCTHTNLYVFILLNLQALIIMIKLSCIGVILDARKEEELMQISGHSHTANGKFRGWQISG